MKFKYKAVKANGEAEHGEREAADRFALAREMHVQGLTLVSAEPVGARRRLAWPAALGGRASAKELIMFAGSLGSMVAAGLALARALEVIIRQTKRQSFKKIVGEVLERVTRGESLHQALAAFPRAFPPVFISMVAAGEESGNLPEALEVVRSQLAKSYDLRRKIKGAMIYPAIIIIVIIIIAALMMIFLVPNLTSLFTELKVDLPLSTRLVVGTSNFLINHYLLVILGLLLLGGGFWRAWRTPMGKLFAARATLRLPGIGRIARELNAAVTMRTLASLIAAGVNLVEAITITREVLQNPRFRAVLAEAEAAIQKGATLSGVFKQNEKLYPVLVGEMAAVGEETGNLSGMLLKGAQFFEEEVDQATKNLSTIIEPALMVLIGIFVGFFAISMLGPMYSLSDAIK